MNRYFIKKVFMYGILCGVSIIIIYPSLANVIDYLLMPVVSAFEEQPINRGIVKICWVSLISLICSKITACKIFSIFAGLKKYKKLFVNVNFFVGFTVGIVCTILILCLIAFLFIDHTAWGITPYTYSYRILPFTRLPLSWNNIVIIGFSLLFDIGLINLFMIDFTSFFEVERKDEKNNAATIIIGLVSVSIYLYTFICTV